MVSSECSVFVDAAIIDGVVGVPVVTVYSRFLMCA